MQPQNTYDLIKRLKRQPRHGADMIDELNDMAGGVGDFMATIQNAFSGAVDLFKDVSKAYLKMATSIDNTIIKQGIGIGKAIELNEALADTYKGLVAPALVFEKRLSVLNKSMGITSAAASKVATALKANARQVNATNKALIPTNEQLLQYTANMQKLIPTVDQSKVATNKFYKGMQDVQHIMTQNVGLTEDQANAYTLYAAQSDHNAASQLRAAKAIAAAVDPDGTVGAFKMITQEVADAGSTIQLQYGRIPGSLENAVLKAKKFGFTLSQVTAVGEKLLDIESSTGDELEYQLLTGRRLVTQQGKSLTNMFREAALQGDATKSADALNQIIEQEGDTLRNNLFARKQMASLLGIEEQQIASALQKKKILEKATAAGITVDIDDNGAMARAAAELQKQGDLSEKELEEFQKATDTRTTEDILEQQLTLQREQLMATYLVNADNEATRNKILAQANDIKMQGFTDLDAMEGLGAAFATMYTATQGVSTVKNFATGLGSQPKAAPAGPAANKPAAGGGDVVSMPGSTHTLVGDYGEIFLDPRDAVAAGPPAAIAGLASGGSNNSDVVQELKSLKMAILLAINSKPAEGLNNTASWG